MNTEKGYINILLQRTNPPFSYPMKKYQRKAKLTTISFKKLFLSTIIITLSMSVTTIVDGFFVGNLLGSSQLAALNMIYPLATFAVMFYVWIGFGGSTFLSVLKGKREQEQCNKLFTINMTTLAVMGVLMTLLGIVFNEELVTILCNDKSLHGYILEYLNVYLLMLPVLFIFGGFAYFSRVDNFPNLASLTVVVANVINIVLDYVYIKWFDMGIGGAALASLSGYILGISVFIFYFRSHERTLHFTRQGLSIQGLRLLKESMRYSTPSALHEGTIVLSLLFVNNMVIGFAGVNGMIIFSVFNQVSTLYTLFLTGVAETMAPVAGVSIGEKDNRAIRFTLAYSMKILILSTLLCFALFELFPDVILSAFGVEDNPIREIGIPTIQILSISLLPAFIPYFMLFYYQLIKREVLSLAIVAFLNIISLLPAMWLLGTYAGGEAIWWALTISEGTTVIFILLISHYISRRSKGRYTRFFLFDKELDRNTMDLTLSAHASDIEACQLLVRDFMRQCGSSPALCRGIPMLLSREINRYKPSEHTLTDVVIRKEKEEIVIRFRSHGKQAKKPTSPDEIADIDLLKYDYLQILSLHVTTYIVKA